MPAAAGAAAGAAAACPLRTYLVLGGLQTLFMKTFAS